MCERTTHTHILLVIAIVLVSTVAIAQPVAAEGSVSAGLELTPERVTVQANDTVTLTATITNYGPDTTTNASIEWPDYPTGPGAPAAPRITVLNISGDGTTPPEFLEASSSRSGPLPRQFDPIAPGESRTVRYTFRVGDTNRTRQTYINLRGYLRGPYGKDSDSRTTTITLEDAIDTRVFVSEVNPGEATRSAYPSKTDPLHPGDRVNVTINMTNGDGRARATAGSISLNDLADHHWEGVSSDEIVEVVKVSGDGTGSPTRFFVEPLEDGKNKSVTYTLQVNETAPTGTHSISWTGHLQNSDYSDYGSTSLEIPIVEGDRFDTNGDTGIQIDEILGAIVAFNEGQTMGGQSVSIQDVLDVIVSFNSP